MVCDCSAGNKPWKFIAVEQFAQAFEETDNGRRNRGEVDMPYDKNASMKGALVGSPARRSCAGSDGCTRTPVGLVAEVRTHSTVLLHAW